MVVLVPESLGKVEIFPHLLQLNPRSILKIQLYKKKVQSQISLDFELFIFMMAI
jgi:hypothetical protein